MRTRICDVTNPRLIIPLVFGLGLSPTAQAQFNYTVANGTVTITGYTGSGGEVVIPDTLEDLPVTRIGDSAFYQQRSITSVTIPDSVISIGDSAFARCSALREAFVPESVTTIGVGAFAYSWLSSVSIGGGDIGNGAFSQCTSLSNVILGNKVTTIGNGAFAYSALTDISIPDSVVSIGGQAFYFCSSLENIAVDPGNLYYSSAAGVLYDKNQTRIIQYPPAKTDGLYTIPGSVTSIANWAFYRCTRLGGVIIPDSVTSIGDQAFEQCTSLTSTTIGAGVTLIGSRAFFQCSSLTSVVIPDHVTTIGSMAFANCWSLTTARIGASVASIGSNAFAYCNSLTHVKIPNSVTLLGVAAFSDCASLTSVAIPASISSIDPQTFKNCPNLRRIYFLGNAPNVDSTAFESSSLATVFYLPATIGWASPFGGRPAVQWNPQILTNDAKFGVKAGQFGFTIAGAADIPVVVEICDDLNNPNWTDAANLILNAEGTAQFSDPAMANHPVRTYRFRAE